MNRRERLDMVRRLMWDNRQMPLQDIAKASGVSLRTTYRDLHSLLSHPAVANPNSLYAKQ